MDGGVSFGGKCALGIVKRGVEPTRHLRGVGSVADDFGEPEDEEGLEASELRLTLTVPASSTRKPVDRGLRLPPPGDRRSGRLPARQSSGR